MARSPDETAWQNLLFLIQAGECLPFIGWAASASFRPNCRKLAGEWADKHDYPLPNKGDLARVAQFLAVKTQDRVFAK